MPDLPDDDFQNIAPTSEPERLSEASMRADAGKQAKFHKLAAGPYLSTVLAYCVAHRLPGGHLVYVAGDDSDSEREPARADQPATVRRVVRHLDVEIHCHVLDLAEPPQTLLDEIGALAGTIAGAASSR